MILKMRNQGMKDQWAYLDKIEKCITMGIHKIEKNWDIFIKYLGGYRIDVDDNFAEYYDFGDVDVNDCAVVRIIRSFDKKPMYVAFQEGCLLNDDGKTIEKII